MKESKDPVIILENVTPTTWDEEAWLEFRNCRSVITFHENENSEEELIKIPRGPEKEHLVIRRSDWEKMEKWRDEKGG